MSNQRQFFLLYMLFIISLSSITKATNVVVVFIIDQFPYYYITRHQNNFKANGFNRFIKNGIFYTKAYHEHGIPETSPGHATLGSGTLPILHGATGNRWFEKSKKIEFSVDNRGQASVINTPEKEDGRSPRYLEVDSLADQVLMHQASTLLYKAYSVGIKETATIATAGQHAPAFWFNKYQGGFTSSHHYMERLPTWVENFNKRSGVKNLKKINWQLCYPRNSDAYNFPLIEDYESAALPYQLAGRSEIFIDHTKKDPFTDFLRTPQANQLVLDFAVDCIRHNYKRKKHEKMLLWVCLSPLDLLGHMYGPDSLEVIDCIHHLDRQLGKTIEQLERMVGSDQIMFTLAADHGIQPIQEISYKRGIHMARRINASDVMKAVNNRIEEEFDVPDFLEKFESTYYTCSEGALKELEATKQLNEALNEAKEIIQKEKGIRKVWTATELKHLTAQQNSAEQFYKNHLIGNRIGHLIVQPKPYCLLTNYPTGCSHNTPYDYDTHIPLAFYQKGMIAKKIRRTVYAAQLAPTLAQILEVPPPTASMTDPLPHVLTREA